ncbi:efflux RND transporter periplasmic adaptor subunit [Endozoicomonadaceae bacterium StTr2]
MTLLSPRKNVLAVTVTVLLGSLLSGCSETEISAPVEVVRPVKLLTVQDTGLQDLRHFPGTVSSSEESLISFRIPGELVEFPVKTAEEVKAGQLLARLDDKDIRNELAQRQADYDLAEVNYKRIHSLREKKVISQSDLDKAHANLKSTKAALRLAKDKLRYSTLTAPFDGRIARTNVENHQYVQAQQTILLLQNSKTLDISIQVPENIMASVRKDETDFSYKPSVTFANDTGNAYPAAYKEHDTSVTPGTQSYKVTFSMPVPEDISIYPGMGATVHVDLQKVSGKKAVSSFNVPPTAVLSDDTSGIKQAWVYNPVTGTVNPVEVTVGRLTQNGLTILSGLKNGDQIAVAGLSRLRPDMKVKPLVRERGL